MTATNHAATGAVIGVVIGQPLLAIPVAFLSHFVCDVIPHYRIAAFDKIGDKALKTDVFKNYLIYEFIGCVLIVLLISLVRPVNWQLAIVCAFVAASPDLFSINRFVKARQGKKWRPNLYSRFAAGIQWFEHPSGAVVEVAWFAAALLILLPFFR